MEKPKLVCAICKGKLVSSQRGQESSAITCGHVFHTICLRAWLNRNQTCPNCRHPVRSKDDVIPKLYFDDSDNSESDSEEVAQSSVAQSGQQQQQSCESGDLLRGAAVGSVITALAFGIGYLLFGGKPKRRQN